MTVAESILVFAGVPLLIILVMAALIFLPGGRKRPRYKSGQAWDHAPIWWEPHPERSEAAGHGETLAIGSSVYGEPIGDGGAHAPVSAGPLGGARGTW